MADYTINVNVDVDEGQLNTLETKLDSLTSKPLEIDIKTNLSNIKSLSKDIKTAVEAAEKSIGSSYKKNKNSLFKDLFDPGTIDTKSLENSVKGINKLIGKNLDLGEVKLSVPSSVMTELDNLDTKLKQIKETAKSIGSIKLKISDGVDYANGQITVGESGEKKNKITFKQLQQQLKVNMQAEEKIRKAIAGGAEKQGYSTQIAGLLKERQKILSDIKTQFGTAESIIADSYIKDTRDKVTNQLNQLAYQNNKFEKEYKTASDNYKKYNTWYKDSKDIFGDSLLESYNKRLQAYEGTLKNVESLRQRMSTLKDNDEIIKANAQMEVYTNSLKQQKKFLDDYDSYILKADTKYTKTRSLRESIDLDGIKSEMEDLAGQIAKGKKYTTEFNAEQKKLIATVERGSGVQEKYAIKYNEGPNTIQSSLTKVNQTVRPLSSYISELGSKFKTLSQYLISNFGFEALRTGVTSGVSAIRELDTAMTELKKTSEGTKQQYSNFTKEANKNAKEIGSTTVQLTSSAADWSRLGYSLSDSSIMAKQTGILKNVSEFDTIEEATSSLVGIMQAYNIQAEDSSALIDQLNKIGNSYSISSSGLAEALQISGSMLEVAGNTKEQSMALVTAMNASIQNPQQAARAARTIAMRLTGVDSETLQAEGEDVDGLIESVPKLEEKIKSLTAVNGKMGVSLTDSVGNFRSTYEILSDIADRWKEIQEADKKDGKNRANDLLETMAGHENKPENYGNIVLKNIFNCKVSLKLYATI